MLHILHVEDDPTYRRALWTALKSIPDVTIEQVGTVAAAQTRLSSTTAPAFDVLLVDLRLPDAREMEAVAALRVYGIPLVVLSATSVPENLERAAEAGADDYLVKGLFDAAQLVRRVRFACRRYVKQSEALASAATSSRAFGTRSLGKEAFEALKPFITCGGGSASLCG